MDGEVAALIIIAFLGVCTAQTTLLPAGSSIFCPGEEVVVMCSIAGGALTWEVRVPGTAVVRTTYFSSTSPGDVRQLGPNNELVFNLTAPLTSTLTTTATAALDGTVVECNGESLTLSVAMISPPPALITSPEAGQTAGTTSATVTVQWAPSTGADNYTVSVTPDLPSLGGRVTTTGTSLELQDVPYNTPRNVSIVATNCAGSSAATETVINIAGCVVPEPPVNGVFSANMTVGPGTNLSLSCSPGYVPSEVMSSTCQSDGSWVPDTAQLECVSVAAPVDCGPPTLAANVTVESSLPNNTTFGSTFSFRCAEGLFPNGTEQAVCGADGLWRPDPANHGCGDGNFDCGAPQPPASGFIKTMSSTLEGAVIFFQCDQGFSPPEERPATCVRDENAGSAVWEPNPAEQTCSRNETEMMKGGLAQGAIVGIVVAIVAMALVGVVVVVVVILLLLRRRSGYNAKHKSQSDQHEMHVYDERKDTAPEPGAEYSVLHHNTSPPQASNSAELSVEYSKLNTNGKQETPGLMYAEVGHQGPKNKKKSKAAAVPTQPSNDDDDRVMYSAVSNITMPTTPMEPARLPVDKTINLDALLIQLADAGALWYQLGEVLGVPRHTLDEIKEACAVSKQFMVEMLDAWLRLQPYPTWREVASALQVIGATELASNILMVYSTGELPKRVNMTEVPVGSLPHDFHSGPPPPIPPKAIGDSPSPPAPARPHRSGAGASKRAPPPIPGKSDSIDHRAPPPNIDYRAPPPLPRSEPPPPQLPTRLDPVSPPSQWPDAPAAPPRPPKVSPRGGDPDAPARPPKPVPRS